MLSVVHSLDFPGFGGKVPGEAAARNNFEEFDVYSIEDAERYDLIVLATFELRQPMMN